MKEINIYYDQVNKIIFLQLLNSSIGVNNYIKVKKNIYKLINISKGKINFFCDITKMGFLTKELKELWLYISKKNKINKIVYYNPNILVTLIANLFLVFSKNKRIRFYCNKENATDWLKLESI
ncbi:hypothetical protein ACFL2K_03820 [Candidatus Margulisiibacteriota bacterium]